jgi:cephalosporin hydroxylase
VSRRGVAAIFVAFLAGAALGAFMMRRYDHRPDEIAASFHRLYHARGSTTYNNTRWLGSRVQQLPLDMWVFQEIIYETRPDVIVETGTFHGGSALYYASLFDVLGHGRVVTVDIDAQLDVPPHPRVTYIVGSSTGSATVNRVKSHLKPGEKVMVILDSDHTGAHVRKELDLYSPLVAPGGYLIVQDTHFNNHPILPNHGPGPFEAVEGFLASKPPFEVDRSREKFLITFNPSGFLRRNR